MLLINGAKDELSYALHVSYEGSYDGLKNTSFYFMEMDLAVMGHRGT